MKAPQTAGASARLVVLLIALAVLVCWVLSFRGHGHDWGGDFSLYIAHARNIALGQDYNAVNYIPENPEKGVPLHGPAAYPPGFPLVLAPVYRFAGLNYGPMRALVQTLWLIGGLLIYLYGTRRGLSSIESAATVGVFLLSSMVLGIKDSVLSESTYLVISVATLLFLDRVYRDESATNRRPWLYGGMAGLLLLAGELTRVTGAALVAAFAVYEIYYARRIRAFAVAAGAVFLAGFLLYRFTLYDGNGYANQFGLTPGLWLRNVVAYLKSPALLWGSVPAILRYPAALLALLLAGAGFLRTVRVSPSVAEFYVALYMLPLLLYSSGVNVRYIVPIYPFILLYCAHGLRWTVNRLPLKVQAPAYAAIGIFLISGAAANAASVLRAAEPDGPEIATFQEVAGYIRTHAGPGDVVISWNPRVVALYTGRPSAYYPNPADPERIGRYLIDLHAKWVLTFSRSDTDRKWLSPFVTGDAQRFDAVLRNSDFVLYRVQTSIPAAGAPVQLEKQ